ncbi:AbiV family abortive infection protein [candidate division KSB1 bacterium]|nr:AbiV family abortive infection protein [candidate division KSB1 bacterium]
MLSLDTQKHLERYWQLSREFYNRGDFALASFLSITLIEEVGKVIILSNKTLGAELDRKGFYNHRDKYIYAVSLIAPLLSTVKNKNKGSLHPDKTSSACIRVHRAKRAANKSTAELF